MHGCRGIELIVTTGVHGLTALMAKEQLIVEPTTRANQEVRKNPSEPNFAKPKSA